LAVVKRISDSDKDEVIEDRGTPVMKRQKSKIDVSATSLLMKSVFSLIFRQFDNFLSACSALSKDKNDRMSLD
jgi:hypothetical protein